MTRKYLFGNDAGGWDFLNRQLSDEAGANSSGEAVYQETCGMCGRTILTGEKTELFQARDSAPVTICLHCREDAKAAGFKQHR